LAAQFDSNLDGVLDAKDAQFGEFAVWQDADQDGVSDAGEVKHLTDLGITSIKLASDAVVRAPATGVTEAGHTTATAVDGSAVLVADAVFDYTLGTASATVQAGAAKSADAAHVVKAAVLAAAAQDAAAQAQPTHCEPSVGLPGTSTDAAATADQVVDVTLNELAPTGTEPVVLQPASALIQNKPYTLSPEQMQEFQDLVTEVTNAVNEGAVNVAISEVTPTGTQPVVFEVPTHCEPSVFLPESMVLDLNAASWNKPYTLSAEQLSELGLPASTDGSLASLNVTDVLLSLAQGVTQSALQVNGTPVTADTLNLSNLLGPDAAPTQLTATGTVQHEGQTYTYQVDANLQALLDQQQLTTS
jgi:hypothetical protein